MHRALNVAQQTALPGPPAGLGVHALVFTRTKWGDNTRNLRRRYTTGVGAHAGGTHEARP